MPAKLDRDVLRLAEGIGEQVRAAREAAGLSQEAVAEKIGMTRTNYARIEHGKTNVTIETLIRIASGLGLTVAVELRAVRARTRRT